MKSKENLEYGPFETVVSSICVYIDICSKEEL